MKTLLIKTIEELSNEEKELFLKNEKVQQDIVDCSIESEWFYIDEMLEYLKPSLRDWQIGSYGQDYLRIDDNEEFIQGLKRAQSSVPILSDKHNHLIEETEELIEEARWVDSYENEEKYAKINIKIIDNIENLKDLILSTFQEIISYASDFDIVSQESDYVENYLYNNSDMEVVILENEVKPIQY